MGHVTLTMPLGEYIMRGLAALAFDSLCTKLLCVASPTSKIGSTTQNVGQRQEVT